MLPSVKASRTPESRPPRLPGSQLEWSPGSSVGNRTTCVGAWMAAPQYAQVSSQVCAMGAPHCSQWGVSVTRVDWPVGAASLAGSELTAALSSHTTSQALQIAAEPVGVALPSIA